MKPCCLTLLSEQYKKFVDHQITLDANVVEGLKRANPGNLSLEDLNIKEGKIPNWQRLRNLQDNEISWCYLNYYFIPCVVGKCMWVSSIQRKSKIRSLA